MSNAEIDVKSLIKFDRNKPFGQVFPMYEGACYDQGGFHFDKDGVLVEHLLTHDQRNKLQAMAMKKQADAIADKARADYFAKQGVEGDKIAELEKAEATAQKAAAGDARIDLVAWAMRQSGPIPWPKVRDAAMKEYSLGSIKSADELRQWMVDQGMVSADVLEG